ncbi:MAG: sulfotransferase, partial [Pseudomonadota bacterium]
MLCSILGRHPDVHLADPKEPHFLAYGGAAASFTGPGDAQTINARAVLDESEWLRLFASDRPVTGEGSVTTLYEYERAIPAIGRHCPEAKVIIVLREPVARAHSAHGYMRARGYETVDFRTALEAEAERRANGWQHIWHYAAESRFTDQVRAFTESFEPDQLHFLYYENLQADPETELGR